MQLTKLERLIFRITPNFILRRILHRLDRYHYFRGTLNTQTPISFDLWYNQKVLGHYDNAYWPIHKTSTVCGIQNIYCGIETCPGYSPGNYIQGMGKIFIDDYTQIAPNVGIISSNHDVYNNSKHIIQEVKIGKYCWIGMGAVILPGVELGDFTIVGSGAVVSKSFTEGYCILGGVPAKIIKELEIEKCKRNKSAVEYNGYIKTEYFQLFRKNNL
ncbi:MAG: acyltransferase, partial [Romboutsia sp.]|nr:acyltransferase [Romboutsia sp.]